MEVLILDTLSELDAIQFRISCGISALGTVHTAMENGHSTAGSYTDALFGVYDYLSSLNEELRTEINNGFDRERGKTHV